MCDELVEKPRQNHAAEVFVDESFITRESFLRMIGDSRCAEKFPAPSPIVYPKANLYYAFAEDVHPMERIVTVSKSFEKEKRLPGAAPPEELPANRDPRSRDEALRRYLRTDPPSFVIFGKPGLDHASVASALADAWNCVLISPTSLIRQEIDAGTERGRYMERILRLGGSVGPEILMSLIRRRVGGRDVKHRGYVVGCLPFVPSFDVPSLDYASYGGRPASDVATCPGFCGNATVESAHEAHDDRIDDSGCRVQFDYEREIPRQIDEMFTTWPRKPRIIVYLACPRQDVANRCARRRVDRLTGDDTFYENELTARPSESERDGSDTSLDSCQEVASEQPVADDDRGLVRPMSDGTSRDVKARCDLYERLALPVIDRWILAHDPQHVVRADGRSPVRRILQILETRLRTLPLLPSIVPRDMIGNDAHLPETSPETGLTEDELAEKSAEEAFGILRRREVVSVRFPWRLSAWRFYCPVELARGRTVKGLPRHAVRFLDKIFFLSSRDARDLFVEGPRTFLSPPNPRPTCKVAVLGPRYAGKSELSARLAETLGGTVINVDGVAGELAKRREGYPYQELHENDSNVQAVSPKPVDTSVDEMADVVVRNIKRVPDEQLEDELRRDGGYVVDGMCTDVEVWRKVVVEADVTFEDIVVLFEEEPYVHLLNKFRTFFHLDESTDGDAEADREEYRMLREEAEWDYLEHLTRFESEWARFEERVPEFGGNVIKCNLADVEDPVAYVMNHIKRRFTAAASDEEKSKESEISEGTAAVTNGTSLIDEDVEEKEDESLVIDLATAERLLECGYYFLSPLGRWCPVQVCTSAIPISMFLPTRARGQLFPVIRRPHVYFLAGEEALSAFLRDPSRYLARRPDFRPPPLLPLRISVIGPPRCGKTTLANRFARTYGTKVITRGKALRHVLRRYPWTEAARTIADQLRAGQTAPSEAVTRAIEMLCLGLRAATQGYILDGCPSGRREAEQLAVLGIQPMVVLDLRADLEFCLECLSWGSDDARSPLNLSAGLLSRCYDGWQTDQASFRDWLRKFSRNVVELDAAKSKWHAWTRADHAARSRFAGVVLYSREAHLDKVHSLRHMCVSPYEFRSRQSRYESCCPVCLVRENISRTPGQAATARGTVQFREHFYWLCPRHADAFAEDPLRYLSPARASLLDERPRVLPGTVDPEHACWARRLQVGGLCLVTYVDGLPERRLTPGRVDLAAVHGDKVYLFCSEGCREKFLARHDRYAGTDIAFRRELPPIEVRRLPDLGFLEQTVAGALVEAANLVAARRPKIYGLSAAVSAAVCIGVHLKTRRGVRTGDAAGVDLYEAAGKRIAGRSRIVEIVTDTMKKKLNPYVPSYPD